MISRKRALRIAWRLWKWLAETGHRYKEEYPRFSLYKISKMLNRCPLCELYRCDCTICELYTTLGGCCAKAESVFNKWLCANEVSTRKQYARQIFDVIAGVYQKEYIKCK